MRTVGFDQQTDASKALTAGRAALLGNTLDETAVAQLRVALTAPDPIVRAVAARLVGATAQGELVDALAQAWAGERSPEAAAEQARAMLFLWSGAATTIEARVDSPAVASVYAEWIAREQPERMAEALPKLAAALKDAGGDVNASVIAAVGRRPDHADRIVRARLETATPAVWASFVAGLDLGRPQPLDAVIAEALSSADEQIRMATVWNVLIRLLNEKPVSPPILERAATPPDRAGSLGAPPATWEQLGREMIARRQLRRQTPDRSALLRAEAATYTANAIALARSGELLDSERKALKSALGDRYPKDQTRAAPAAGPGRRGAMRTLPLLWPGFLRSLLDAAGCRATSRAQFGVAAVTYRSNGTLGKASVSRESLPPGCAEALNAMLRLTLADFTYSPSDGTQEVVILPFGPDAIECSNSVHAPGPRPSKIGGTVAPPRKTRDVRPDYPPDLQRQRIQGTVVVESTITRSGCVSEVRVLETVAPALDFSALRAVLGWRFTPTILDGQPVPVVMTVTVNFTLM